MRRLVRRTRLAAAFLILTAMTAAGTQAETIVSFTYSGRGGPDFAGLLATGSGTFAFADGLATIELADLSSFTFSLDENTPNSTTFGLADLTSFSASLGPGRTMTALTLGTGAVQGTNPSTEPREFSVGSLGASGAWTSFRILGLTFQQTTGSATVTAVTTTVPEPSSGAMAAIATLILFGRGSSSAYRSSMRPRQRLNVFRVASRRPDAIRP
ncbi:hypothetical protein [Paludisphaera mucosa]|uniref:PEP-CTERM protein-sorting domain-containing protein n=1 Tax=Paludisphaera mucosa TaxID=3030827 RepID=A0ABT6FJH9_9BACT|nr:hypothetical protein [Paludisphaera mucosa]MDG3007737.1 hypothetical protein [Paludisphaera mucosa]